jgi:hypothetical protein
MVLVKLFRAFQVETCDKTAKELDFVEGVIGILTHEVVLKFKRRPIISA